MAKALTIDGKRLYSSLARLGRVGAYTDEATGIVGVNRLALTSADGEGRRLVVKWMREAGLHGDAAATTLEVPSPFNYAAQGTLIAAETHADPKNAAQFTAEMVDALLHDIARVEYGALVLFTSREQMRQAVDALPTAMRSVVLVQNALPRTQLLKRHRERVENGEPSVIFGMQSFEIGRAHV